MPEQLKNKLVIGFAIFGAGLALVLGLAFRVSLPAVLFRMLIGALLMGALAFGLDFFLKSSLSPEDYRSLMGEESSRESVSPSSTLDIVEESPDESAYAELYASSPSVETATRQDSDSELLGVSSPANDAFQEQSFSDAPRVSPIALDDADEMKPAQAVGEDLQKLNQAKKEETLKRTAATGQVKFNAGSKQVSADPEIIAKAIRTVLHREG